jgi:RNA polymerase sigma-70 factor (ECF subfamily)
MLSAFAADAHLMARAMAEVITPRPADADWSVGTAERELVARLQAGDERAFDELIEAYQQPTARLASRLLGWCEDVDDVVQDVFVRVLENVAGFRGESRLSTWLAGITINCCRAHRRRQRTSLHHLFRLWQTGRRSGGPAVQEPERHADVRRAVRRLTATYAEPIVLRYFEQLSIAEIGEILKLPANTVEARLSRGRRKLRRMLEHSTGDNCG